MRSLRIEGWRAWRSAMFGAAVAMLAAITLTSPALAKTHPKNKGKQITVIAGSVTPGKGAVVIGVKGFARHVVANHKTGFFVLRGATLAGPRTLLIRQGKSRYELAINAPAGSRLMLHQIALDATTGTASAEQEDLTVRGTLAAVDCTATPNTLTVATSSGDDTMSFDPSATIIQNDATGNRIVTCADLASYAGQSPATPVAAQAIVNSSGALAATEVDLYPSDSPGGSENLDFKGAVASSDCPTSFVVTRYPDNVSVTVNLSANTQISIENQDNETPGSCADLANGAGVEVEGTANPNGTVNADTVTIQAQQFESSGTIGAINCGATPPSFAFTPANANTPLTVTLGPTTQISVNDNDNATCADLSAGAADVEGVIQPDGSVAATSVDQSSGAGDGGGSGGGGDN